MEISSRELERNRSTEKDSLCLAVAVSGSANKPGVIVHAAAALASEQWVGVNESQWLTSPAVLMAASHMPSVTVVHPVMANTVSAAV